MRSGWNFAPIPHRIEDQLALLERSPGNLPPRDLARRNAFDLLQRQFRHFFRGRLRTGAGSLGEERAAPAIPALHFQREAPELGRKRLVQEEHMHPLSFSRVFGSIGL